MHALHERVFRAGVGDEQRKQKESLDREYSNGRVLEGRVIAAKWFVESECGLWRLRKI